MNKDWLAVHKSRRKKIQKNKRAQALIEYVLLLTISAGIAIALSATFNQIVRTGIRRFNAVFESELRTGEFNEKISTWEN